MNTLEIEVQDIIDSFVNNGQLFTALDVSNKVKESNPQARHREVRDLVKKLFSINYYATYVKTPIQVTLADGTKQEAILYHDISDSWNLDAKYDSQKRSQTVTTTTSSMTIVDPSAYITPAQVKAILDSAKVNMKPLITPTAVDLTASERWAQIFSSSPSLFPMK